MFSRSDLDELLEVEAEPAVSLYRPTHPARWEVRRDPIRLKNLLSSAAERLAAARRKPEIDALLAPAVEPLIKPRPAPVILAAHPEVQGHFREIAGWKDIYPDGLWENPDAFTRDELHRRACGILEQRRIEAGNAAIDRLNARLGTGKATTRPQEIVKAARHGRVDTLFVTGNDHLWGKIDETEDRIVAHGSASGDDIDLLNYAVLMTLRQRGSVTLVDRAQLPAPGLSAAILRH